MNAAQYFEMIRGKSVTFCGVGRSHLPLIELYLKKGAVVSVRDRRTFEELQGDGPCLAGMGAKLILGTDYLKDLNEEIIFRTPGMKYYEPALTEARKRGSAVTSEMETFFELCPCKLYAVTGSDGKTTTTTILSEILKAAGKTVHLGGNIGKPLLPEIESIQETDCAVAELSSFQLISMRKSPDVAVVTNLSPNHLDMHKDMQEYIDAKKNIFLHQGAISRTVLNADNDITAAFADETRGDTWLFSRREKPARGCFCDGKAVYVQGEKLLSVEEIKLPGWHNVENYMAAISTVWGDVPPEAIRKVAKEFGGVEHRAEFVREFDGVKYYHDSIASSPTRLISGTLSLYDRKIILICGGYDKHIPYDPLGPAICERVKTLIVMGATGPKIEEAVRSAKEYKDGAPLIVHAANMEEAVNAAREASQPGDIVSLSPASAAFDLYKNFEDRGKHFKELVGQMKLRR